MSADNKPSILPIIVGINPKLRPIRRSGATRSRALNFLSDEWHQQPLPATDSCSRRDESAWFGMGDCRMRSLRIVIAISSRLRRRVAAALHAVEKSLPIAIVTAR
jgi:hypothetical protein